MSTEKLGVWLKAHIGDAVQLEFSDGHVVDARVITVDLDEPSEVIYDVLRVVQVGPSQFASVRPGIAAAAAIADLRRVRIADEPNT